MSVTPRIRVEPRLLKEPKWEVASTLSVSDMPLSEDVIANERRRMLAYATIRYPDELTVDAPIRAAVAGGVNQRLELNGMQVHMFFGTTLIALHFDKELLEEARGACIRLSDQRWLVFGQDLVGRRVLPFVVHVDANGLAYFMARCEKDLQRAEALLRMSLVLAIGW
jgi:hypothetical protein